MKFRKVLSKILLIFLAFSFISCGKNNDSRYMDIPEDGIIKASVFEDLMFDEDMLMLNGETEGISYQWLFMGSLIEKPVDTNLLLNFINSEDEEQIKEKTNADVIKEFSFSEEKKIEAKPTLSITFDEKLDCSDVSICKYDEDTEEITIVTSATLEIVDKSIVTFTVVDNEGDFFIVGKENSFATNEKNINEDNEVDANTSSSEGRLTESKINNGYSSPKAHISTGERKEQDKYLTDPVPEGKQEPVEWQDVTADKSKANKCILSIRCDTLLDPKNYAVVKENGKASMVPSDGVIYPRQTVTFYEGEFVFDVLLREVKKNNIHMEFSMTPIYNSNYIEGINNLYEFDGGELSGWMYKVNGWFPNYGCSRYLLKDGDVIEWVYTCDLGRDVGCEWLGDQ